jgi:hypothetical protein
MNLCKNLTIDNWLTIISLAFVAIGGVFIYFQWKKSLKIKRAEFINQIIEKLRFDDDLPKTMYEIEYRQNWYSISFHESEFENDVDKLFSYIDYICYLRNTNNISKKEFQVFKYEIHRICVSVSTQIYLWNLYHFSKGNNADCSFQHLIDYGIKNKLFPKDFKKDKTIFPKTLNW